MASICAGLKHVAVLAPLHCRAPPARGKTWTSTESATLRSVAAGALAGPAATVIASQALISGVFSLVYQGIRLGYFPRITVRHTSRETMGQIYVPFMNAFVAVSAIALVLVFRESGRLAAAFGLAVSGTMAVTSLALYRVARIRFGWSPLLATTVVGGFLVIDLAVSSVLLSMGMMQLPPVMISMPLKILLFVMVDGWYLIVGSLVKSVM